MIDVKYIDLEHIEHVADIEPEPTLAVSEDEHYIGSLGEAGKRLMKELLAETDESEPMGDRVFGRLGVSYQHARWRDFDLYWVDEENGNEALVEALKTWNSARNM